MKVHKRLEAGTAVAAIAIIVAIPSLTGAKTTNGTAASSARTLRFFDKPVATTLTTASGKVISRPPFPQPQAGDVLDVYSLDYVGNQRHHAARWTMSTHLRCAFAQGPPACESNVASGGSLLVFDGNKLAGATGSFAGATGRVLSDKQLPGTANESDVSVRIVVPRKSR
ncbi:MAG: hypothetical protein ACXVUE_24035 [Solirubrobacteraceae bacterium]